MNDLPTIRHAVLAAEEELKSTVEGRLTLARGRPTAMRGPVALVNQANGWVSAIANLEGITQGDDPGFNGGAAPTFGWSLSDVVTISRPFQLRANSFGPLWARLKPNERRYLLGTEDPADDADELEPESRRAHANGIADLVAAPPQIEPDPAHGVLGEASPSAHDQLAQSDPDNAVEPAVEIHLASSGEPDQAINMSTGKGDAALPSSSGGQGQAGALTPSEVPSADAANVSPIDLNAARARAMAFVPAGDITDEVARKILVDLRETEIKSTFPGVRPGSGLLRKTLLDRLIDEAVESIGDFERLIPRDVQLATDKDQIEAYLDPIVRILAKIR